MDPDGYSIQKACGLATEYGLDNVDFLEATLNQLPERSKYDFILAIDCIHDLVDPVGGLQVIWEVLAESGIFL